MPNPDDERFEIYLKQFRPLVPDAMRMNGIRATSRRHLVLAIWAVGAAAMAMLGVASVQIFNGRSPGKSGQFASVKLLPPNPPLTMRGANALLAAGPSYKAVMNELALFPKNSRLPKDKQSALAVLGKEKIKL